jgi:hypothetical protein
MQKVAKELLGMLGWPAIAARLAAAEAAVAPLAGVCVCVCLCARTPFTSQSIHLPCVCPVCPPTGPHTTAGNLAALHTTLAAAHAAAGGGSSGVAASGSSSGAAAAAAGAGGSGGQLDLQVLRTMMQVGMRV